MFGIFRRLQQKPLLITFTLIVTAIVGASLLGFAVLAGDIPAPVATPTSAPMPSVQVSPAEGGPGTLITVTGEGWRPGDIVFLRLDDSSSGQEMQTPLASAMVTDEGNFTASFIFPSDAPWADLPLVQVRVWSPATGDEAFAVFQVSATDQTPAPAPTATATSEPVQPQPTPTGDCIDEAAFVRDVTIPDNTHLSPGQHFVKTWRLRNSGTCTWTTDYALVFAGGDSMDGPAFVSLPGTVAPGNTVDLSVNLVAPTSSGTYKGNWQLRNADGVLFGTADQANPGIWVQIVVGPTATPTPVITAWRGEYYKNRDLTGAAALVRDDAAVNFDWGSSAPAAGLPADGFSVRWSRTLSFQGGIYRFYARADDGVRVWLDGQLIIDQWHETSGATYAAERTLSAAAHTLRVEYYENWGTARIQFWWERLGDFPQWRGEYFSNVALVGGPALVRNDTAIDFNWWHGAPATGLPADRFSARWTRVQAFAEGVYRFHAVVDDGVRLYVDDALVIDSWYDGGRREVTADRGLSAGYHSLRVEYYELTGSALIQVWWEKSDSYPDWRGEYWSNRGLSGSPVLVRNDSAIDFNWGWGTPATAVPSDNFSARWTRRVEFDAATYRFHVVVDDGARLWLDDQLIIDSWRDGGTRELTADYALVRGTHDLRVEFYEHTRGACIHVWWEKISSPPYSDWKGEYWSNRHFNGGPALVRNDEEISFDWGRAAVAAGLPADDFSARWSRKATFEAGVYRFHAWADDGIRLYVDGDLVLDEWHDSRGDEVHVVDLTLTGQHQLVVEYYERSGEALARFWWKRVGDWPPPTPEPTQPPTAVDDFISTGEDTPVDVNVLVNDSDPDGDTLTVSDYDTSSTQGGTVSCASAGVCTYNPPADFNGTDIFAYTANDGKDGTDIATVTVIVNSVNDPPVVVDDSATTDEDTPVDVNVLANDSDPDGDTLTVSDYDTSSIQGGTVICASAGVCTYNPPADFNGTDIFAYTANDGKDGTDIATVTVIVNSVNDPPVAADDSATTDEDTPVDVNVLVNDSDPDGDTLTVSAYDTSSTQGGTVSCASAGACTYSPRAGFNGTDTFAYTAGDGNGSTDTATVTVIVNLVNNPPVAVDDSATTDEDTPVDFNVLANDSDPDGDTLTVSDHDTSSTQGGTVSCADTGACTYSPRAGFNGTDTFAYTVSDDNGSTDTATVTVTVNPPTPPPPVVYLNEVLPAPAAVDWDEDGTADSLDEWIELYNAGTTAVDLGGWLLDDGVDDTVPYLIPEGTVLEPGAFVVFYRQETGIVLEDSGGEIRLLGSDGAVMDSVVFGALVADGSYSRDEAGDWHTDWPPSPGEPNLPSQPTPEPGQPVAQ